MPDAHLRAWRARADAALTAALPSPDTEPAALHRAMRHAVLLGGRRLRPLRVYGTAAALGCVDARVDAPAVAVELVHAYSLVHDDLPAMDDDALRRGQPTVHIAFDEATAILAGDALQTLAFEVLAHAPFDAQVRVDMLASLARAAGAAGMCGGQALDLAATGAAASTAVTHLEHLHALKTGGRIRSAVRMGAQAANASARQLDVLDRYASALGLAFQIRDDLLDIEGDSATLGKTPGKDVAQAKATFPALIGVDASRARLRELATDMQDALDALGRPAVALAALGRQAIERDR